MNGNNFCNFRDKIEDETNPDETIARKFANLRLLISKTKKTIFFKEIFT
jgi:hypothetical protein